MQLAMIEIDDMEEAPLLLSVLGCYFSRYLVPNYLRCFWMTERQWY